VSADRSHDADATVAAIAEQLDAMVTSPPRRRRIVPRACDYAAYKERHPVECFIGKREYFRRVFSRFDKYAARYLASSHCASTCLWLRESRQQNLAQLAEQPFCKQ